MDEICNSPPQGDQNPELRCSSPLRIRHLIAWMTLAALLLAYLRIFFFNLFGWNSGNIGAHAPILAISQVAIAGQGLISILALRWKLQKRIQKYQPGEWLATPVATNFLASNLQYWSLKLLGRPNLIILPSSCWMLVAMVALFVLCLRASDGTRWRTLYAIQGVNLLAGLVALVLIEHATASTTISRFFSTYEWLVAGLEWLSLAIVALAGAIDYRAKYQRRWTHWLGVLLWSLQQLF